MVARVVLALLLVTLLLETGCSRAPQLRPVPDDEPAAPVVATSTPSAAPVPAVPVAAEPIVVAPVVVGPDERVPTDGALLPFAVTAYTGACPSMIGAATTSGANGWSCLAYREGVMQMCVGTEEAIPGAGDLATYVRVATDGMPAAHIQLVSQTDIVVNGTPAIRLLYDEPGAPARLVSYLFARGGRGFTATCTVGPPDGFEAALPTLESALQTIRFR